MKGLSKEVKSQNICTEKLESDKAMLQEQIDELMKLTSEKHKKLGIKDQKHYGWQPCHRADIVLVEKG